MAHGAHQDADAHVLHHGVAHAPRSAAPRPAALLALDAEGLDRCSRAARPEPGLNLLVDEGLDLRGALGLQVRREYLLAIEARTGELAQLRRDVLVPAVGGLHLVDERGVQQQARGDLVQAPPGAPVVDVLAGNKVKVYTGR